MIEAEDSLLPKPEKIDQLIEDLNRLILPTEPSERMADSLKCFMVDARHLGLPPATIRDILGSLIEDREYYGLFNPLRQVCSRGRERLIAGF